MPQMLEIDGLNDFSAIKDTMDYEALPGGGGSPFIPAMRFPMAGLGALDMKKLLTWGGIGLAAFLAYKYFLKK